MAATTKSHGITPKTADPDRLKPKAKKKAPAKTAPPKAATPVVVEEGLRCLISSGTGKAAIRPGLVVKFIDGVFERPGDMSQSEWVALERELLASGEWERLTRLPEVVVQSPLKVEYVYAHPDYPDAQDGQVFVEVPPRGEVRLEMEGGIVKTEDPVIGKALEAKGYVPSGEKTE